MKYNQNFETVHAHIQHLNLSLFILFIKSNKCSVFQSKHCTLVIFLQVLRKFHHYVNCVFSDLSLGVLGISKLGFPLSVADDFINTPVWFMLLLR